MSESGEEAFTALLLRYLDGEATAEETALLKELLASDPELGNHVVSICRLHGHLAESAAALSVRPAARHAWRRRVSRPTSALLPAFAAAGFAAVIVLALAIAQSGRSPASRATAISARVEPAVEE